MKEIQQQQLHQNKNNAERNQGFGEFKKELLKMLLTDPQTTTSSRSAGQEEINEIYNAAANVQERNRRSEESQQETEIINLDVTNT